MVQRLATPSFVGARQAAPQLATIVAAALKAAFVAPAFVAPVFRSGLLGSPR
jgi:hypothetical protein